MRVKPAPVRNPRRKSAAENAFLQKAGASA